MCCQKLCLFHQCICPVCEDALVFNKKSLLHFLRAGKYEKEVHILRKYIGDILIGTYEEKLQLSQLSHNRIELVEVLNFSTCQQCKCFSKLLVFASWTDQSFPKLGEGMWQRALALNALDWYWRDHLVNMNRLRSAVSSSVYFQTTWSSCSIQKSSPKC
jgi:preprotein translocase subunit SecA